MIRRAAVHAAVVMLDGRVMRQNVDIGELLVGSS